MDPKTLIPAAGPVPVPWGWFEGLSLATFIIHLLFMNIVLGGALIMLVQELRGKGRAGSSPLQAPLAKSTPTMLALAVNFGVAPLLFTQVLYGQFLYTSCVLMAWQWLGIAGVVMLAYYGLYLYDFKFESLQQGRTLLTGGVAVLLLVTAFTFTNVMTLMLSPERWVGYFSNQSGFSLSMGDASLWPRFLHVVLSALAIAGLFMAVLARRRGEAMDSAALTGGLRWFFWPTALQVLVGAWYAHTLPKQFLKLLVGGDLLHTAVFFAGLATTAAGLWFAKKRSVYMAASATVVTVALMAGLRALLRSHVLAEFYSPQSLVVTGQYSPMWLFFIALVLGGGVMIYILRLAARAGKEA